MSNFIATATAAAVFAGIISFSGPASAQAAEGALTRADVVAQLTAARASGELAGIQSENGFYSARELGNGASSVSRASVVEALQRARASGELDATFRESYAPQFLTTPTLVAKSTLSRDEVKADLARARSSGEFARHFGKDSHAF